jgi:transglutaminase-like putative cysteine protease
MKSLFSFRSILSLMLLIIAALALVAGVRSAVKDVEQAAFVPVAMAGTILGYLLGLRDISTRRAWAWIFISGLVVITLEAARLPGPLLELIHSIPQIQLGFWKSIFAREAPDLSLLVSQLNVLWAHAAGFVARLWIGDPAMLRECMWDIPLLLLPAWSGWRLAHKADALTALAPGIALQGALLAYTTGEAISLQVSAFCLLTLLGLNQKWSMNASQHPRAVRDSYTVITVFSFALVIGAGLMPVLSVREAAQTFTDPDAFDETLGLKRDVAAQYSMAPTGLPLEHLIGSDPSTRQTVVFTVDTGERLDLFDEEGAHTEEIPRHYWRSVVYDVYNGSEWTSSFAAGISYDASEKLLPLAQNGYQIVHQEVDKASASDDRLYWTGTLARVDRPFEASWRSEPSPFRDPLLTSDMLGALTEQQSYAADSFIPILSEEKLRASSTVYPAEVRQHYLDLPDTISERVIELADELTAGIETPYDRARAIESYLRTFPYELAVPPPNGHEIADYFLFDLKTGYCDYYATSMIVLARAAGIPARLVIGYSTGEYDPASGRYVVRELHAHSWVEVYFTNVGWVEFEPTANRALITLPDQFTPQVPTSPATRSRVEPMTKSGFFAGRNYTPLVFALGLVLTLFSIWFMYAGGLLRSHESIGSIYAYVYLHGKRIYDDAPVSETPTTFARKLQGRLHGGHRLLRPASAELEALTNLYMRETYSAHPVSEDERRQAVRIWRSLFWRLLYARAMQA